MNNESSLVTGIVFLKSKSGKSLTIDKDLVTSKKIEEYRPKIETINNAIKILEKLGFAVAEKNFPLENLINLTITGKQALFEKVFKVKLHFEKRKPSFESPGGTVFYADGDLMIPQSMKDVVDKVVLGEPVEFFE